MQILPFSNAMFEPLMVAMANDYDCIAIDLMGYGQSDPRRAPWTVEYHATVLDEALSSLSVHPVCLVGGHFTAMVATEFALSFPRKLDKLVLDGVPLWPRTMAAQRLASIEPPKPWTEDGSDLSRLWTSAFGLLRKFDPDLKLTAENTAPVADAVFGFIHTVLAVGSTEAIFRYDLESRLPHIAKPTLVIGSPTDSLRDRHEKSLALIPGAHGHLFDTVHPLYTLDRPERAATYADVLDQFIRS